MNGDDAGGWRMWDYAEEGEKPTLRLTDALDRNDLDEVRRLIGLHPELLNGRVQASGDEFVPIEYAAYGGQFEIVRYLLAAGARPDEVLTTRRRTALSSAAWQAWQSGDLYDAWRTPYFRVIRLLIDAGADPHCDIDGHSPDGGFRLIHQISLLDALAEFERRHGHGG